MAASLAAIFWLRCVKTSAELSSAKSRFLGMSDDAEDSEESEFVQESIVKLENFTQVKALCKAKLGEGFDAEDSEESEFVEKSIEKLENFTQVKALYKAKLGEDFDEVAAMRVLMYSCRMTLQRVSTPMASTKSR